MNQTINQTVVQPNIHLDLVLIHGLNRHHHVDLPVDRPVDQSVSRLVVHLVDLSVDRDHLHDPHLDHQPADPVPDLVAVIDPSVVHGPVHIRLHDLEQLIDQRVDIRAHDQGPFHQPDHYLHHPFALLSLAPLPDQSKNQSVHHDHALDHPHDQLEIPDQTNDLTIDRSRHLSLDLHHDLVRRQHDHHDLEAIDLEIDHSAVLHHPHLFDHHDLDIIDRLENAVIVVIVIVIHIDLSDHVLGIIHHIDQQTEVEVAVLIIDHLVNDHALNHIVATLVLIHHVSDPLVQFSNLSLKMSLYICSQSINQSNDLLIN